MITEQPLKIYTDGSCDPNPGYGGWAAIIVFPPEIEITLRGSDLYTTNNRMEFSAPLAALGWMERMGYSKATIFTDSRLVVDTLTSWIWGWEKSGYKKSRKNLDLIQPLHELQKRLDITWTWVRGHNGHHWNEKADKEAEDARIRQIKHILPKRENELILL